MLTGRVTGTAVPQAERLTVLVTGATGFLGRHVLGQIRHLHVVPWTREAFGDLLEEAARRKALERVGPNAVLHLGWAHTGRADYELTDEHEAWTDASLSLASTCAERGIWFLGCGSAADGPNDLRFTTPYARAKQRLRHEILNLDGRITWLSPQFVFSYAERRPRLLAAYLEAAQNNEPFFVAHAENLRDFIHVVDVASGVASVLDHGLRGRVYLGSGTERSPQALVAAAANWGNLHPRPGIGAPPRRADETPKQLEVVGWRPTKTDAFFASLAYVDS